ncbi:MAG: VOC family protein [Marinibacterium sp.]|nr:VOC family protein [Marinibacterium sp.]
MARIALDSSLTLALGVRDRHASAAWYHDMLGFELLYHMDDAGWSEMQTRVPGVTLGLNAHAAPGADGAVPVFGVGDLAASRAALEAAGVAFDGPSEVIEGMVALARLRDPDGNQIMLAQDLSNPQGAA